MKLMVAFHACSASSHKIWY